MDKTEYSHTVEQPDVVISFKVAENAFIRCSITREGELYLNASWGTLYIRPDSANTCFVAHLPLGTQLKSKASRIEGEEQDGH